MSNTYHHDPIGETTLVAETTGGDVAGGVQVKYDSTNGTRKYRYVYNALASTRAAGLPCFYDLTGTTYRGLEVTQATTGNLSHFAGVHAETANSSVWCWIQTLGYNSAAAARRYNAANTDSLTARAYLTGINGIDALVYEAAADGVPPGSGYCINIASTVSVASSLSSTTHAAGVYVFGTIR